MNFDLTKLIRNNIQELEPYSCARDEFKGRKANVFLDANESPYNQGFNRYPDPLQEELKTRLSTVKHVPVEKIFLGNGSDEAIDLVYRIFCQPGTDNVVAIEPTYGMYRVCAEINDIEYRPVLLDEDYNIDASKLLAATDQHTKVIWVCSPNNPTGNALQRTEIERLLNEFHGIVVVDEAYSDFSQERPFRYDLAQWPNLIVLNTFSKAWGCAALRLGMAFASTDIIALFNKVKYPYNVNQLTQQKASEMLQDLARINQWVSLITQEREHMLLAFNELPICQKVYHTDANFFLAKVNDATSIYNYLIDHAIVVRNRNRVTLCQNCLRITIGTPQENSALLAALRQYKN
ncbi:MAG: histidinol-phosphate transaminase [Bacteroidales bacterium]|nr:histidinol-phosphate transaminase [Candidatus Physcousia equi]